MVIGYDYNVDVIGRDSRIADTMSIVFEQTSGFPFKSIVKKVHLLGKDVAYEFFENHDLLMFPFHGEQDKEKLPINEKQYAFDTAYNFVKTGFDLAKIIGKETGKTPCLAASSNIIDYGNERSNQQELELLAMEGLIKGARESYCGINAGETAVLLNRVKTVYNICGAAICVVDKGSFDYGKHSLDIDGAVLNFFVAPHNGLLVYSKSDGTGSKPKLNMERFLMPYECNLDVAAMTIDDIGKRIIEEIVVQMNFLEAGSDLSGNGMIEQELVNPFNKASAKLEEKIGVPIVNNWTDASDMISGYGTFHFNPNGTAVSLITEENFYNPPKPNEGDSVIFIANPNPSVRSNGVTKIGDDLIKHFGTRQYHRKSEGLRVAREAARGSTIFFHLYQELFRKGASYGGHYSGGGYDKKMGSEFAKQGLGGEFINNLAPHPAHQISKKVNGWTAQKMADKYAYCAEGYVCVPKGMEQEAVRMIQEYGLEAEFGGTLKKMDDPSIKVVFTKAGAGPESAVFTYNKAK